MTDKLPDGYVQSPYPQECYPSQFTKKGTVNEKMAINEKCCSPQWDKQVLKKSPLAGALLGGKAIKQYLPKLERKADNWREMYLSLLKDHVRQTKQFTRQLAALEAAYKEKMEELRYDMDGKLEEGYEAAYQMILEYKNQLGETNGPHEVHGNEMKKKWTSCDCEKKMDVDNTWPELQNK